MRRDGLIRPVPELLKEHAESAARRIAYADSSRGVTYAELERRTRALAGYLTRTGLRRGDRVAICLGNRVEAVESCLAVLRAGIVGVPLNPRSSDAELAHFLRDSGAAHVITDAAHLAQLRRLGRPYDDLPVLVTGGGPAPDGDTQLFESVARSDVGAAGIDLLGLDDPAWMLYTSGTTDRPKGVVLADGTRPRGRPRRPPDDDAGTRGDNGVGDPRLDRDDHGGGLVSGGDDLRLGYVWCGDAR
ncbi:AMP-binding protein, partial [Streptomyces sp. NPDC006356]